MWRGRRGVGFDVLVKPAAVVGRSTRPCDGAAAVVVIAGGGIVVVVAPKLRRRPPALMRRVPATRSGRDQHRRTGEMRAEDHAGRVAESQGPVR